MSIFESFLIVILLLFGGYLVLRLFSKALFRSYFETKKEFNTKTKEERKDGKV